MIAEGKENYQKKRENSDGDISFEKILLPNLCFFDLDRGGNTVIRYHDRSVIKYMDFRGRAVYNFLLKAIPQKLRK